MNCALKEFDEIRPYEAGEMKQAFEDLINDRQFSLVLKGFAPWLPKALRNALLRLAFTGVKTPLDFQKRFMKPVVNWIIRKHTDGCTFDDASLSSTPNAQHSKHTERYTFLSNHRDIVLDSAFLDVMLVNGNYPTTVEIGIGDNLLIYPWIKRLVRMNKAFTVRRGLTAHEMMRSSQLMSRYIHYAVTQKRENIWIAQREGRAKDSDDRTQDSVLKMLAMGGPSTAPSDSPSGFLDSLRELNIVPLTISYQFDPCDYLKAKEMQLKRDNPAYKKSKQDDLDNMRTGIFGEKGEVVYRCGTPINTWIDELRGLPKNEFFTQLSRRIDREIHAGYELYYTNYLALDMLEGGQKYCRMYYGDGSDSKEVAAIKEYFEQYLQGQIDKIKIDNKDEAFLRECMLTMYANPLRNYLKTKEQGGQSHEA
ncbi:MAG: acyltransferase [Prevotella sp.]|nr:acyltransferase [Prevotella sp.]